MSSPTSSDLFNVLSEEPMSATALAERTGLPLTTVKYHLENMLTAGLIEVSAKRWSTKGREMKIYAVKDQIVLIAPKKKVDVREIIERYGVVAGGFAVICSMGIAIPSTLLGMADGNGQTSDIVFNTMSRSELSGTGSTGGAEVISTQFTSVAYDATHELVSTVPPWVHEGVMIFFIVGIVILGLMMTYELISLRRNI